jgi:hypothetical protein
MYFLNSELTEVKGIRLEIEAPCQKRNEWW